MKFAHNIERLIIPYKEFKHLDFNKFTELNMVELTMKFIPREEYDFDDIKEKLDKVGFALHSSRLEDCKIDCLYDFEYKF